MTDRREQILARLLAVIGEDLNEGVPGVRGYRNRDDVSGDQGPAIIVHDAAEAAADGPGRPKGSLVDFVVMSPQVFILAGSPAVDVGSVLNSLRALLVPAVLGDALLLALCGNNGEIRYVGCGTVTAAGEQRAGIMEVSFSFQYVLSVNDLLVA